MKHGTAAKGPSALQGNAKWMALSAAVLGWMFDGLEMGIFPLVGRPALTEMLNGGDIGPWFGRIIAVFLVGAAFGGFALGWLGDRIGRTRAMVWSVLAYSVFSGLGAIVTAPWQLAVFRFLAALGMGGQWALGVALVMEIFPNRSRPLMAGVIGASANIGFLLIALLAIGLNSILASLSTVLHAVLPSSLATVLLQNGSWRLLMVLSAFPALLTFLIRVFVPESEMWEANSKKVNAKVGLSDLFKNGLAKHTILGAALGAVALMGTWASVQWIPAWAGKLASGIPNVAAKVQIASALGAIVFSLGFGLIAERFNRRNAYFALSLLSLVSCMILFRLDMHYGAGFLFWTFFVGGITAGFYGLLPLYLPELFPTRVRAMGSGVTFNAGRMIAAGGAIYGGALVKSFGGDIARMCSIVSLVYVLGLVLIWFAPETKGKPLPE
ncbi:MAG TPA: MFS transporter [Fibrobacteria bacterium]|nr:MFS transporter [Fibrobacteria bacterium]